MLYISRTYATKSRKKKTIFHKAQCQSIIILLISTSKNVSSNLEACQHHVLSYFKGGQWKSGKKSHLRKMKSDFIITASFQVHS